MNETNPYAAPPNVADWTEWFSGVPRWLKLSAKICVVISLTVFVASIPHLVIVSRTNVSRLDTGLLIQAVRDWMSGLI